MAKPVAFIAVFLVLHAFAGAGEGTVLCVGESGHQRIELANAAC